MLRDAAEVRETHISRVWLSGDRAYKLKKPVRLPFLDYSSLERRHTLCREEVRLNRRLAPDVYRGVRARVPRTGVLEPAVLATVRDELDARLRGQLRSSSGA